MPNIFFTRNAPLFSTPIIIHLIPTRKKWTLRHKLCAWAAIPILLAAAAPASGQSVPSHPEDLHSFESEHYRVHTTLDTSAARFYAAHMDTVFEEYTKRFRSLTEEQEIRDKMSLYLFKTQEQYIRYMSNFGITADGTDGMYFYRPPAHEGLATFTQRAVHSISETFATLQHEGFHQFAAAYIGDRIPIWANEGIAQYFEDGIVTENGHMRLGIIQETRLRELKKAIDRNAILPFERLLSMSGETWHRDIMSSRDKAQVAYAQCWSMAYFLINADKRYRKAFLEYLKLLRRGTTSKQAFASAFKTKDMSAFRRAWEKYVRALSPGPLAITKSRLNFLGRALLFLEKTDRPIPDQTGKLRRHLQKLGFTAIFVVNRIRTTYSAENDEMFQYPAPDGKGHDFEMLPPEKDGLLPRIYAPHLQPRPTLAWYRTEEGTLMYDLVWTE